MVAIRKQDLGKQGMVYLSQKLGDGLSLARATRHTLLGKEWSCFAWVPDYVSEADALDLEHGGKIQPQLVKGMPNRDLHVEQVRVLERTLMEHVNQFLSSRRRNVCILEDRIRRSHDGFIQDLTGVPVLVRGDEVYYLVEGTSSIEQFERAFGLADSWLRSGFLVHFPQETKIPLRSLGTGEIDIIANHVVGVFTSAYDRESSLMAELLLPLRNDA